MFTERAGDARVFDAFVACGGWHDGCGILMWCDEEVFVDERLMMVDTKVEVTGLEGQGRWQAAQPIGGVFPAPQ